MNVGLQEIETYWSLNDVLDGNDALEVWEDAEREQAERQRREAERRRRK